MPHLVHKLKQMKQWETPNHCLFNSRETIDLISNEKDFNESVIPGDVLDILISTHLDKESEELDTLENNSENESSSVIHHDVKENATETIYNLISDANPEQHSTLNVNSLLKDL